MSINNATDANLDALRRIVLLLWGNNVQDDTFRRWTQGFSFSPDEPTALVQFEGGPCVVIAPVQAFILKNIITSRNEDDDWKQADLEDQNNFLVDAFSEILTQAYNGSQYYVIHTRDEEVVDRPVELNYATFHDSLRLSIFSDINEVKAFLRENIGLFRETYGVLLFLYSVLCSRGLETIQNEISGTDEPLIDYSHGYGSQAIINLLITGNAVPHLFNETRDVGGMTLYGIPRQSSIGFLTLLEHLRYCEVGSYLKKPRSSVWVLGSETHLTVLFSFEKRLANSETPADVARRVFSHYDPEGNNFIASDVLGDLLQKLDLFSDNEYVNIMRDRLDGEKLGIILLTSFMDEFFPENERSQQPDVFKVYHYNGQPQSNPDSKVVYHQGTAVLLECDVPCTIESDSLTTCLQTKWPSIDIQWNCTANPSLN
ncbi:hypothetical protein V9T40_011110 [Parthenolecanium corni]|uniref:Ubiquitin carboxyl-terminal hydrolase MINDY n=1 Tax=Parthenolecanium corni TaxID=536013 RepID=A0AAN9T6A2_9HEMI